LFVGNLSYATTEADLRTHFGAVAPPSQVVLPGAAAIVMSRRGRSTTALAGGVALAIVASAWPATVAARVEIVRAVQYE